MPIKSTRRGMLFGTAGIAINALSRGQSDAAADAARLEIGVIGDMSSTYADVAGRGSVEATAMAIEDFGDQAFRTLAGSGCRLA